MRYLDLVAAVALVWSCTARAAHVEAVVSVPPPTPYTVVNAYCTDGPARWVEYGATCHDDPNDRAPMYCPPGHYCPPPEGFYSERRHGIGGSGMTGGRGGYLGPHGAEQ